MPTTSSQIPKHSDKSLPCFIRTPTVFTAGENANLFTQTKSTHFHGGLTHSNAMALLLRLIQFIAKIMLGTRYCADEILLDCSNVVFAQTKPKTLALLYTALTSSTFSPAQPLSVAPLLASIAPVAVLVHPVLAAALLSDSAGWLFALVAPV